MEAEAKLHRAPYANGPPRNISDEELQFLSNYTGERDLVALRRHVLKVWAEVKAKVSFACAFSWCPAQRAERVCSMREPQSITAIC